MSRDTLAIWAPDPPRPPDEFAALAARWDVQAARCRAAWAQWQEARLSGADGWARAAEVIYQETRREYDALSMSLREGR